MFRAKVFAWLILTVSLLAISVSAQKTPLLTFADLTSYKTDDHTFRIVGYVLDIYKCPPCPPHAMCKPCIPNNVIIVNKIGPDPASLVRLRVITDQIGKFAVGNRYLFTVKVYGELDEGKPITDVTLIRFEALPLGDPPL